MFPSYLLRTISTIAIMGRRKRNKPTIRTSINSCGPIIPKSAIKVVLKVSDELVGILTNIVKFTNTYRIESEIIA